MVRNADMLATTAACAPSSLSILAT
eukprot:COSAG02_NODE_19157_length_897_cov_1.098997_1_plen_24_part_10